MSDQPRRIMLPRDSLRNCRKHLFEMKVADSTGVEMTGGSLLMRTLIFRRILTARRHYARRTIRRRAGASLGRRRAGQHGPDDDAPRAGQSQLHGHLRDAQLLHRAMWHSPRGDQPQVHGAVRFQIERQAAVPGRSARTGEHRRQNCAACWEPTSCRRPCSSAGSACTKPSGTTCSRSSTPRARPACPRA